MVVFDAIRTFRQLMSASVVKWRQEAFGLGLIAIAAVLSGCAAVGSAPPVAATSPPEQKAAAVRDRVNGRWQALIAGDLERAYAFLSPASRQVTTLEQYKGRIKTGHFRAAKIDRVDCEAETCKVRLWLTYDHTVMKEITTPLEEAWVLENGQFWYVYRG
jgi:hypothetical protein